jgi:hypothetical protein
MPIADAETSAARDRSPLVLLAVVIAFTATNSLMNWLARWVDGENIGFFMFGIAVAGLMQVAVWTALGAGPIIKRLAATIPCVLLLIALPSQFTQNSNRLERWEFLYFAIATYGIFIITLLVFLIFRRFTRFRLQTTKNASHEPAGLQFSTKYLLALITLYAAAIGLAASLRFDEPSPDAFARSLFGPNFFIAVLLVGGGALMIAALPTLAVPLAILRGTISQVAIAWTAFLWISFVAGLVVLLKEEPPPEPLGTVLSAQAGATLAGAITAALLRRAGLRLTRPPREAVV